MTKLVFFGNEQLSSTRTDSECHSFRMLINEGYSVEKLVIKGKPQKSRKPRVPAIVTIAEEHHIPVVQVSSKSELKDSLSDVESEIAVLAAFGIIVPQEVIDSFKYGIVNIHPSLLPKYRGTTPIETAILNADERTGVSVMALSAEMDAGPIYAYGEYHSSGLETKAELTDNLGQLGAALLREVLPGIIDGTITAKPQDDLYATFTPMLTKDDSVLDFTKSADQLAREVTAHLDWPGSKTSINDTGLEVLITEAEAISGPKDLKGDILGTCAPEPGSQALLFVTGAGYLRVTKVKPAGKSEMPAGDFINGYLAKD